MSPPVLPLVAWLALLLDVLLLWAPEALLDAQPTCQMQVLGLAARLQVPTAAVALEAPHCSTAAGRHLQPPCLPLSAS